MKARKMGRPQKLPPTETILELLRHNPAKKIADQFGTNTSALYQRLYREGIPFPRMDAGRPRKPKPEPKVKSKKRDDGFRPLVTHYAEGMAIL